MFFAQTILCTWNVSMMMSQMVMDMFCLPLQKSNTIYETSHLIIMPWDMCSINILDLLFFIFKSDLGLATLQPYQPGNYPMSRGYNIEGWYSGYNIKNNGSLLTGSGTRSAMALYMKQRKIGKLQQRVIAFCTSHISSPGGVPPLITALQKVSVGLQPQTQAMIG